LSYENNKKPHVFISAMNY